MSTKKRVLKSMGYPLAACAAFAVMNTAVFAETDENQPDMAENQASETTMTNDQQTSAEPSIEETEQQQQQDEIDQINEAIDQRQKLMQKNNANNLNAPNENNAETEGEDSEDVKLITDRPEQSEEVKTTDGTVDDRDNQEKDLSKKYSVFVDEKTGVYRLTYTISEDAEAEELTIDLTKALNALSEYGAVSGAPVLQPGDSRVFEVFITSESGHVYAYKKGSFVLTTPKLDENLVSEDPDKQIEGFDYQVLEERCLFNIRFSYAMEPFFKLITHPKIGQSSWDGWGAFTDYSALRKFNNYLLNNYGDNLYDALEAYVLEYYSTEDKVYQNYEDLFKSNKTAFQDLVLDSFDSRYNDSKINVPIKVKDLLKARYDHFYNDIMFFVYGEDDVKEAVGNNGEKTGLTKSHIHSFNNVTDYSDPDHTVFNGLRPAKSFGNWWVNYLRRQGYEDPENTLVSSSGYYGFENEDGSIATSKNVLEHNPGSQELEFDTYEASWKNTHWADHVKDYINTATIGEYMKGDYTESEDIWERADNFFHDLLKDGVFKSQDTEKAAVFSFLMAFNVDLLLAGNDYQDTAWGWHNTIKLERVDGEFKLEKVDDKGNPIDATFQLWYYVDVNNDGQYTDGVDDKYFYTTIKDESGKTIPGFVKYDPSNKTLEYTIDTTGGKLDINYKMLEGITYYLQEVLAPKGYNIDSTVYIICDEDSLEAAESMVKQDSNVSGSAYKHAGAIDSQTPLTIRIVNTKETTPPEPEEPKKPTPPEPEEPVAPTPEQPKIEVATGVFVDAQLWMSLMGASAVSLAGARRLKRRNRTK